MQYAKKNATIYYWSPPPVLYPIERCFYFETGGCLKGAACPYLHPGVVFS